MGALRVRHQQADEDLAEEARNPGHMHVHPCCANPPTQHQTVCPPPKRQGNPAGACEREEQLVSCRQVGQQQWRSKRVSEQEQRGIVGVVLVIVRRGVITASKHGEPKKVLTLNLWGFVKLEFRICFAVRP